MQASQTEAEEQDLQLDGQDEHVVAPAVLELKYPSAQPVHAAAVVLVPAVQDLHPAIDEHAEHDPVLITKAPAHLLQSPSDVCSMQLAFGV